jgi:hypothetical protein
MIRERNIKTIMKPLERLFGILEKGNGFGELSLQ